MVFFFAFVVFLLHFFSFDFTFLTDYIHTHTYQYTGYDFFSFLSLFHSFFSLCHRLDIDLTHNQLTQLDSNS